MAFFLFIPGGKRTKDDWDAVRAILEAGGHETQAITLADPEHASLRGHIDEVRQALAAIAAPKVVLVGHSYGGLVITGAAAAAPKKVARLVYVDTALPENGRSLLELFRLAGVDYHKYGVPEWPPFEEPLFFDHSTLAEIPKTYIHCLHSEFLEMTRGIPATLKSLPSKDHWQFFELASDHYCMLKNPEELAVLLTRPRH